MSKVDSMCLKGKASSAVDYEVATHVDLCEEVTDYLFPVLQMTLQLQQTHNLNCLIRQHLNADSLSGLSIWYENGIWKH